MLSASQRGFFPQQWMRWMKDPHQFLLRCDIWETGGHRLRMLCLLVITFYPRLMMVNRSLAIDESSRGDSQEEERDNCMFEDWESRQLHVSISWEPLSFEGTKLWSLNTLCPAALFLNSRYISCCGDTVKLVIGTQTSSWNDLLVLWCLHFLDGFPLFQSLSQS